jgi:hypothetical protein
MHAGIVLVARLAEIAKGPERPAVERILRDERAELRLAQKDRASGVFDCGQPAEHEVSVGDSGDGPARDSKSTDRRSAAQEHLDARLATRRVGDDERPVGRQIECGRVEEPSRFGANRDQFACALESGRSDEHGVSAPIEDEVIAPGCLLAAGDLLEASGDVRGEGRDGRQVLDFPQSRRGG